MASTAKPKLINWQLPMKRVLYALAPAAAASIYFFGWRALAILAISNAAAFAAEYLYIKYNDKGPVTSAAFVSATILALSLPPTIPLWMAAVGIIFGIIFGKMVFGGFGRNVFNPAMVGRAFLYISFGKQMTTVWAKPYLGLPGGFAHWSRLTDPDGLDAITKATPLKELGLAAKAGQVMKPDLLKMFLGIEAGSLGETCALLLILGGIFIIWKKAANYRLTAGAFIGFILTTGLLKILHAPVVDILPGLIGSAFIFGAFFIVTDPISGPTTDEGRWIFGIIVGALTVLIRTFSVWPEGFMFAILLGNMFNPLMDHYVKEFKDKQKKRKAAAA